MFSIDERLKGLPAVKDQVVALYESLNHPHLAVPGRAAGPAQAFILGLRGPSGFAVFVYLFMPSTRESAVYVPSNRSVSPEQYEAEEAEAIAFTESMGFMMDNLNFRGRPVAEQEHLMRSLPVFQREPPPAPNQSPRPTRDNVGTQPAAPASQPTASNPATTRALGKLFGAFCLAALSVASSCKHVPEESERNESQLHYDMGVQMQVEQPQNALREFDQSLALDPDFPEANNAKGVMLHVVFGRHEEAIAFYKKAIEVRPTFSDAKVNLANVYLDQKRFDDAIALYSEALNDMLYATPYVAHANLGWALYKKGDAGKGVSHIKSALTINPRFCLGYRNLGTINEEQGNVNEACHQFAKFREMCPDVADAYFREGTCQAKKGDTQAAITSFGTCADKAGGNEQLKDDCRRLKDTLSGAKPRP